MIFVVSGIFSVITFGVVLAVVGFVVVVGDDVVVSVDVSVVVIAVSFGNISAAIVVGG